MYQQIRQKENIIKRYVAEKLGFDLIVHQHFIKLEKIPVEPKAWMGVQSFSEPMDYAIFCCGLAFTEQHPVDAQFLLSELTEEIQEMYPGEFSLNWTNYQHRKSLVRALKKLAELQIIKTVDGDIDLFSMSDEQEVLYEVTVYARYFMRSYPDDLFEYDTPEEILASEWKRHEGDERRKRVYRKLMLSPAVHRQSTEDPDFAYIRNFRNRLRDDFEEHTPFRLEVFKNAAMLMLDERKQKYTLFPDQRGIVDVVLHFNTVLRSELSNISINDTGDISLTISGFERLLEQVQRAYQHGWSKQYREMSRSQLRKEMVDFLCGWELLETEKETGMLILKAALGRMTGAYPKDYTGKGGENNDE